MEELDLDNILDQSEIESMVDHTSSEEDDNNEKEKNTEEIDDINPEGLFDKSTESVGGEDNKEEGEDADKNKTLLHQKNFYLNIAKALKEDSVLPDLDETDIEKVNDADGFSKLIQDFVSKQLAIDGI